MSTLGFSGDLCSNVILHEVFSFEDELFNANIVHDSKPCLHKLIPIECESLPDSYLL